MTNTYTQCYFHLVFSVKNRDALIRRDWKYELEMPCYKYDAALPHSRYVYTSTKVAWCSAPLIFVDNIQYKTSKVQSTEILLEERHNGVSGNK